LNNTTSAAIPTRSIENTLLLIEPCCRLSQLKPLLNRLWEIIIHDFLRACCCIEKRGSSIQLAQRQSMVKKERAKKTCLTPFNVSVLPHKKEWRFLRAALEKEPIA